MTDSLADIAAELAAAAERHGAADLRGLARRLDVLARQPRPRLLPTDAELIAACEAGRERIRQMRCALRAYVNALAGLPDEPEGTP